MFTKHPLDPRHCVKHLTLPAHLLHQQSYRVNTIMTPILQMRKQEQTALSNLSKVSRSTTAQLEAGTTPQPAHFALPSTVPCPGKQGYMVRASQTDQAKARCSTAAKQAANAAPCPPRSCCQEPGTRLSELHSSWTASPTQSGPSRGRQLSFRQKEKALVEAASGTTIFTLGARNAPS